MSLCPPYDVTSGTLAKYRWLAREGLAALTKEERHGYGKAEEQAILAKLRSELLASLGRPANPRPRCASGTPFPMALKFTKRSNSDSATRCFPPHLRYAAGEPMPSGASFTTRRWLPKPRRQSQQQRELFGLTVRKRGHVPTVLNTGA